MMGESIVCLLDILGYSELVKKFGTDDKFIEFYENIINKSLSLKDRLYNSFSNDTDYTEKKKKLIDNIRLITFSDTIIFILYTKEINHEDIKDCLFIYLNLISTFCTLFISNSEHLLRGGMSIGEHYDNCDKYLENKNINLFMFSRPLVTSHELENTSSFYPRILVDKKLIEYIHKISFNKYKQFFYEDFFYEPCLRMYSHFIPSKNKVMVKDELFKIKEMIQRSIEHRKGNRRILEKLYYFSNYHDIECKKMKIQEDKYYFNFSTHESY